MCARPAPERHWLLCAASVQYLIADLDVSIWWVKLFATCPIGAVRLGAFGVCTALRLIEDLGERGAMLLELHDPIQRVVDHRDMRVKVDRAILVLKFNVRGKSADVLKLVRSLT